MIKETLLVLQGKKMHMARSEYNDQGNIVFIKKSGKIDLPFVKKMVGKKTGPNCHKCS